MFCMGLRMPSKATGPGTASILTAAIILMNGAMGMAQAAGHQVTLTTLSYLLSSSKHIE
jgi:hypothetical protein